MHPVLAQVIAAICTERDGRFREAPVLVQQLLSEYGEHDLANRLFAEIPRDVPFEVVADLFALVLKSGNEGCADSIARSTRSWLRQTADSRKLSVALRVVEQTQAPAAPGRHHRRLSNVRRLLKALGLNVVAMLALVAGAQAQPRDAASQREFLHKLSDAAIERTQHTVRYDPGYVAIAYPGGDVPPESGVCTDEVIRSYRALGIDLQKEVHEDIVANFSAYPIRTIWRRDHADHNIDHRRVPNLMVFFRRKGQVLLITANAADYRPGDLVTWDLGHGLTHIGIVVDRKTLVRGRYMVVHNIGQGPKMEDVLFDWKITGHYRYFGPAPAAGSASSRRSSR